MSGLKFSIGTDPNSPVLAEFTYDTSADADGYTHPIKISKHGAYIPSPEHPDLEDGVNGWDFSLHGYGSQGVSHFYYNGSDWDNQSDRGEGEPGETYNELSSKAILSDKMTDSSKVGSQVIVHFWLNFQQVKAHFIGNDPTLEDTISISTTYANSLTSEDYSKLRKIAKEGRDTKIKFLIAKRYTSTETVYKIGRFVGDYVYYVSDSNFIRNNWPSTFGETIFRNKFLAIRINKSISESSNPLVYDENDFGSMDRFEYSFATLNVYTDSSFKLYNSVTSNFDIDTSSLAYYEGTDKDGTYILDGASQEKHGKTLNLLGYLLGGFLTGYSLGDVYFQNVSCKNGDSNINFERIIFLGNYIRKMNIKYVSGVFNLIITTKQLA